MAEWLRHRTANAKKSFVQIKLPIQISHYGVMNSTKHYECLGNGLNPFSDTNNIINIINYEEIFY